MSLSVGNQVRTCSFQWECNKHVSPLGGKYIHTCGLIVRGDGRTAHRHHHSFAYSCSIMSQEAVS